MGILRILLALAVVIEHSGSRLHGQVLPGLGAVEAFFMISGFYIALILNRKYSFPGATKFFYQQRYLRLIPMYWLAVLSTVGMSGFYSRLGHHATGKLQIWAEKGHEFSGRAVGLLLVTQATMLGLDGLMFCKFSGHPLGPHFTLNWMSEPLPAVRFMLVPPAWSLSLELLFYLVAPLLVRRSIRLQLTVAAATFALRLVSVRVFHLPPNPWNNYFFPFEAGLFLLGSVAFQMLPVAERMISRMPGLRWGLTGGMFVLIVFYDRIPLAEEPRRWVFLGCLLCAIPMLFAASQRDRVDRWIGEMSYPLYLLHQVTLYAAQPLTHSASGLAGDAASILLPLGVAAVAYGLVERPFEQWRARRFERQLARAEAMPALEAVGFLK